MVVPEGKEGESGGRVREREGGRERAREAGEARDIK